VVLAHQPDRSLSLTHDPAPLTLDLDALLP